MIPYSIYEEIIDLIENGTSVKLDQIDTITTTMDAGRKAIIDRLKYLGHDIETDEERKASGKERLTLTEILPCI